MAAAQIRRREMLGHSNQRMLELAARAWNATRWFSMHIATVRSLHRFPVKSMGGETLDSVETTLGGFPGDREYALRDERRREIRGAKNWPALMLCSTQRDDGRLLVRMPDGTLFEPGDARLDAALSQLVKTEVRLCAREPATNRDHYRRRVPGSRIAGVLARSPAVARGLQKVMAATGTDAELRQDFGREQGEPMPDLSKFPAELFEFVSPPGTYFDAFPIHVLTTATLAALSAKHPDGRWDVQRFRPNIFLETGAERSGFVELDWQGRKLQIGEAVFVCQVPTPRCSMVLQAQPGLPRDPQILRTIVRDAEQVVGIYASVERAGRIRIGDPVTLR
jgi:uncharacterized protein